MTVEELHSFVAQNARTAAANMNAGMNDQELTAFQNMMRRRADAELQRHQEGFEQMWQRGIDRYSGRDATPQEPIVKKKKAIAKTGPVTNASQLYDHERVRLRQLASDPYTMFEKSMRTRSLHNFDQLRRSDLTVVDLREMIDYVRGDLREIEHQPQTQNLRWEHRRKTVLLRMLEGRLRYTQERTGADSDRMDAYGIYPNPIPRAQPEPYYTPITEPIPTDARDIYSDPGPTTPTYPHLPISPVGQATLEMERAMDYIIRARRETTADAAPAPQPKKPNPLHSLTPPPRKLVLDRS